MKLILRIVGPVVLYPLIGFDGKRYVRCDGMAILPGVSPKAGLSTIRRIDRENRAWIDRLLRMAMESAK